MSQQLAAPSNAPGQQAASGQALRLWLSAYRVEVTLFTVAFFVLSVGPLLHAWSCRSPLLSVLSMRPLVSVPLLCATAVSVAVQAAVFLPSLRAVFHVTLLDGHHIALVGVCAVSVVVVVEIAKLIDRRRPHREEPKVTLLAGP